MARNLRTIDPQLLETLVVIAETGSFAAAADQVGRTRSAITMQMQRLEGLLQLTLFEPSGRTKRLTAAGDILVSHAKLMLQLNENFWTRISQDPEKRLVRFGAPEDYMEKLIPGIIGRFSRSYPDVVVDITCEPSEILNGLVDRGKLDVALVTRAATEADIGSPRRREPLVWVAAKGADFPRSRALPLSVFQPGCLARRHILDACATSGLDVRVSYSSPSLSGLLSPVRAGLALTAIARCSIPQDLVPIDDLGYLPKIEPIDLAVVESDQARHLPDVQTLVGELRAGLARHETLPR